MSDDKRRGGRPATGKGVQIVVRAQPDLMAAVDSFCAQELDAPSRPEALRRLAWMALKGRSRRKG
jgi:hypothetical protein